MDEFEGLAVDHNVPATGPELFILRLKGNERFTFTSLSAGLFGIWVHWSGNKSCPHWTDPKKCFGCKEEMPKRWKGFVHCFCFEKKQEVFLELTPASAAAMLRQLPGGRSLRGIRLTVHRTRGDNGRLTVQVDPYQVPNGDETLPAEKSPMLSLQKLWGIDISKPMTDPRPSARDRFFGHPNGVPIGTHER